MTVETTSDLLEYRRGRGAGNTDRPLTHSLDLRKEGLGMNPTQEHWRPVVGYEGFYEVSDHGQVRGIPRTVGAANGKTKQLRTRVLQGYATKSGHRYVDLYRGRERTKVAIHRLVLKSFVGPAPEGHEGCHRNDDPADNRLGNLYWGTRTDNLHDAVRNGKHAYASRDHCSRGHKYTPESTYIRRNGSRACRPCQRAKNAAYKARKRSEAMK